MNMSTAADKNTMSWTAEENNQIAELRQSGATLNDIAKTLGRTFGATAAQCSRLISKGLLTTVASGSARSTRAEIGNAKREGAWTDIEEATILRMREDGAERAEIAVALGRSENTLQKRIHKLQAQGRLGAAKREIESLVGRVFERLAVLERCGDVVGSKGQRYAAWLCKCACGNTASVKHYNLLYGYTKSCGCIRAEIVAQTKEERRLAKRASVAQIHKDRLVAGVCISCGLVPPEPWSGFGRPPTLLNYAQQCSSCRDNAKLRRRLYVEDHKARGLCTSCATKVEVGIYCRVHWLTRIAKAATGRFADGPLLEKLWQQQAGRCAYTGLPLTPGYDASIDHMVPPSRGGARSIENLCWAHTVINRMKSDMTHAEFTAVCELVLQRGSGSTLAVEYLTESVLRWKIADEDGAGSGRKTWQGRKRSR